MAPSEFPKPSTTIVTFEIVAVVTGSRLPSSPLLDPSIPALVIPLM